MFTYETFCTWNNTTFKIYACLVFFITSQGKSFPYSQRRNLFIRHIRLSAWLRTHIIGFVFTSQRRRHYFRRFLRKIKMAVIIFRSKMLTLLCRKGVTAYSVCSGAAAFIQNYCRANCNCKIWILNLFAFFKNHSELYSCQARLLESTKLWLIF